MIRVLHVITGLGVGGAELMLRNLLQRMDRTVFNSSVIGLGADGAVGDLIRESGLPVEAMGMSPGWGALPAIFRLRSAIARFAPDVVQTWMSHANLLGGLAARGAGVPVLWGIHQSNVSPELNKRTTLWVMKAGAALSRRLPAGIVCCSEAARRAHLGLGYAPDRMTVIPNGFDTEVFRPDERARGEVRRELGLAPEALAIGVVARFDPHKDHENFFRAARIFAARRPEAVFVLCGAGVDPENPFFASRILRPGLEGRCRLLGLRRDVPRIVAALDVSVSPSVGEGFPTAVGEAMSCAVPCVVTDVGDSALLVGETGIVVPPRDPEALSAGMESMAALPVKRRRALGDAARRRIVDTYGIERIAAAYGALYLETARRARRSE